MAMDKHFASFLFSVFAIFFSSLSCAVDLSQAYQDALTQDPSWAAAQARFNAGKENKTIGLSGLLPTIALTGTDMRTDNSALPDEYDSSNYAVSLSQPLFNVSLWYNYKSGNHEATRAQYDFQSDQQDFLYRVANSYFSVLSAQDTLSFSEAEELALKKQLEQARQRFDVGLVAITDVREAEAAYDESRANQIIAQKNVDMAYQSLSALTGTLYDSLATLLPDFPIIEPQPNDMNEWVHHATESSPRIQSAKYTAKAAKSNANIAKGQFFPSLTFDAQRSRAEAPELLLDPGSINTTDATQYNTQVGLSLSMPLFTGLGNYSRSKQARYVYEQSNDLYLYQLRNTTTNTRSYYLQVVADVATVEARQLSVVSSKSSLEATEAGYQVGTRNIVDVLNAQRNLFLSQQTLSDSRYSYILNSLRLKQLAGALEEQDLLQLNDWLAEPAPTADQ